MMHPMRKLLASAGIALIFATISASGREPALRSVQREGGPYRLVPGWGTLPNGAVWGEVPGMAIDAGGIRGTAERARSRFENRNLQAAWRTTRCYDRTRAWRGRL